MTVIDLLYGHIPHYPYVRILVFMSLLYVLLPYRHLAEDYQKMDCNILGFMDQGPDAWDGITFDIKITYEVVGKGHKHRD
jgi:hypothetical protein